MGHMRYSIVFLLTVLIGQVSLGQTTTRTVDLRTQWLVPAASGFKPYDNQSTSSVFFWVSATSNKGGSLLIAGRHPYSIWVNSALVWSGQGSIRFSVDSLAQLNSKKLFLGVFSPAGFANISTNIEQPAPVDASADLMPRRSNYFLDFALIAALLLLVSLTLFWRTNPALTRDYFNLSKLITSLDRTESGFGLRIASSVNVLYYLFGSCFLALILLVGFHLMGPVTLLAHIFRVQTTVQGFLQWALLSLGIAALMMAKLIWIALFAALFGFKGTVRFQFFNFVRVIFISVVILAVTGLVCVLFYVQSDQLYYYQLYVLVGLMVLGCIVAYIKLMARLPYHYFHLFSYLCASEIIPLMMLTKMILY